jgi:hypothetical protein
VGKDDVSVGQLYPKHCVWERLNDRALDLDYAVFVGHALTSLLFSVTNTRKPNKKKGFSRKKRQGSILGGKLGEC